MDIFKQAEIFQRFESLIQNERTGNPQELSTRLRISRSQLYRLIEILKDYGAPIAYNRKLETFYYKHPFRINIKFGLEDLSQEEIKCINGGKISLERFFRPFFETERFYLSTRKLNYLT